MSLPNLLRRLTLALRLLPGGVLIGEVVRKAFVKRSRLVEVSDFDGDLRLLLDLGEHMQSQIFWHGSYSRNLLFLLRRILQPGMTMIDAGANIGEITLVAARKVGPSGRIFAFEPVERFAEQLERNVASNGLANVEICRCGVAESAGTALIFAAGAAYDDGTRHDGLATLFRSAVRGEPEGEIELVSIDEIVAVSLGGSVDVIKLDIEGAELSALKGARATLQQAGPDLIIEIGEETCRAAGYEMADIFDLLEPFGYLFHRIERKGRLRRISRSDLGKYQNVYCTRRSNPPAGDDGAR